MRPVHVLRRGSAGSYSIHRQGRMGLLASLCSAVLVVPLAAMAAEPAKPRTEEVIRPMQGVVVPAAEYPEVERQALDGSAEAARRLTTMYLIAGQLAEAIFWGSIAAENGSQVGAYNLGHILAESPDPRQRRRGRFWLERSVTAGGEIGRDAALELEQLKQRELGKAPISPSPFPERYPKWPDP